jgi:isopentenyl diphosphate isomerase/L-lactate dehydrogenase-like FMN-dependent dehydrogenase
MNLLHRYEEEAAKLLPRPVYDYYAGGADDETTLAANRAAFAQYALRPRVLVDVSDVDCRLNLFGDDIAYPVLLAPTAFQRLAHRDGELATARAAAALHSLMIASTLSTSSVEEIAAAGARLWFQLYVFRDRSITEELVRRAEAAGCRALVLTTSVPVQGNRERDARNRFRLPSGTEMANFRGMRQATFPKAADGGSGLMAFINAEFDPTLTWEALAWLRSITSLPVLLKGIMHPADARLAVEHGVDGIIVSNHGGRQLDAADATLNVLPDVAGAVAGRVPVLMDGGVRRGTDVVKALLLGARAVLIGRPYLWALAVEGQAGVEQVLKGLRDETRRTLALMGARSLAALEPDQIVRI